MYSETRTNIRRLSISLVLVSLALILTAGSSFGQKCRIEGKLPRVLRAVDGSIIFANTATSPVQFDETSRIFVGRASRLRFGYSIKNVSKKTISKITIGLSIPEANGISGYHQWFEFPPKRRLDPGMLFATIECPDAEEKSSAKVDRNSGIDTWPSDQLVVVAVVESVEFEDGSEFNNRKRFLQIEKFILDFVDRCRDDGNCAEFEYRIKRFLSTPIKMESDAMILCDQNHRS